MVHYKQSVGNMVSAEKASPIMFSQYIATEASITSNKPNPSETTPGQWGTFIPKPLTTYLIK